MTALNSTMIAEQETSARLLEILGELSARFINASYDEVDGEIVAAQRRICEAIGIERCTLWQLSETRESLVLTHYWSATGEIPKSPIVLSHSFPWVAEKMRQGETLRIDQLDQLPSEAFRDRETFIEYNTKSSLAIPLRAGSMIIGAMSCAATRVPKHWSDELVRHLQLVAQVFANALDRKDRDRILREREARLSLAGSAAGLGFWGLEAETGAVWGTGETRAMLNLPPDGRLHIQTFFNAVLPEDRQKLLDLVERSLQSGESLLVDARVVGADGDSRWVAVRGRRTSEDPSGLNRLTGVLIDISERKRSEEKLKESIEEIKRLRDLLYAEADLLKGELEHSRGHAEILGESAAIGKVLHQIRQVGQTSAAVLITGETGTGKELVARAIHGLSARKEKVMVKVDCASLPPGLIESELFGRERGAYTGALARQIGRFQLADKSTIFLDEIGELPLEVQTKLLRVLDTGEFEPLGSPKTVKVNVRVIAATNRNLEKAMREGRFREDLYFRLRVFPIEVPPLRERAGDIPMLVWHFIRKFSGEMGKNVRHVRKQTMDALQKYNWPGNVRELRNLIERALIGTTDDTLQLELPSSGSRLGDEAVGTLADTEKRHIRNILEKTGWRIKGPGGAAELLNVKPSTLYAKMNKLGIPSRSKKDQMVT